MLFRDRKNSVFFCCWLCLLGFHPHLRVHQHRYKRQYHPIVCRSLVTDLGKRAPGRGEGARRREGVSLESWCVPPSASAAALWSSAWLLSALTHARAAASGAHPPTCSVSMVVISYVFSTVWWQRPRRAYPNQLPDMLVSERPYEAFEICALRLLGVPICCHLCESFKSRDRTAPQHRQDVQH